jgi:predicted TIM-barrel fold metal-dependent hydrolase
MSPAVDSHAHVFAPGHPFASDIPYVPHASQQGTPAQFRAVLDAHGFTHGLLVAAQPYLYDNSVLLKAIAGSGRRFKGIALARPGADLQVLADGGVIGIRFNLSSFGMREFTGHGAERLLAEVAERGWFLQVHCERDELAEAMPVIRRAGVRVMIDHFGRPDPGRGVGQPGFVALLELGRSGRHVVKLSGPFRASVEGYPYRDVDPFIEAAIAAFTLDRCVWGSDWPFVRVEERIDYGPPLRCVERWLPDPADRRRLLWETPAKLFGFG